MRSFRFFGFCMIGLMDRFSTIRKGYGDLWSFEVIYKTATAGYKVYIRKSKVENLGGSWIMRLRSAFEEGSQDGIKLGPIKLEMYGEMREVEVLLGSPCEYR